MNKEELVDAIASETGASKVDTKKFLEAYIKVTQDTLAKGETIQLIGFVTFSVVERAAREGRNPQTGNKIEIPASKVLKVVPGKQTKEAINNSKGKAAPKKKK
jgi:DNA-binding protein HU-beta